MKAILSFGLLLALVGCQDEPVDLAPVEGTVGEGDILDLGTAPYRDRRRMDIDQLQASVLRVTDGIDWVQGNTNQFERFRDTLGAPDYINSTAEDTAVSVLFLKFVDDMARRVCDQLVRRETGSVTDEDPRGVLFVSVDPAAEEAPAQSAVDDNLAYLLLRYHGRRVDPGSAELDPWRQLYAGASAAEEASQADAWEAVCVGMMNHPDFYTY
ncbi:MAG: hypothetical protein AAGE52_38170 [Myxococcota bacterium]